MRLRELRISVADQAQTERFGPAGRLVDERVELDGVEEPLAQFVDGARPTAAEQLGALLFGVDGKVGDRRGRHHEAVVHDSQPPLRVPTIAEESHRVGRNQSCDRHRRGLDGLEIETRLTDESLDPPQTDHVAVQMGEEAPGARRHLDGG